MIMPAIDAELASMGGRDAGFVPGVVTVQLSIGDASV
jgi:hypothetical protein